MFAVTEVLHPSRLEEKHALEYVCVLSVCMCVLPKYVRSHHNDSE